MMGAHSAFFGPGKYGILPEMLRERDLPRANGFMLMLTFLAIIFGTVAGALARRRATLVRLDLLRRHRVIGTATALLVRRVPPRIHR
jgi:hypothetical protein